MASRPASSVFTFTRISLFLGTSVLASFLATSCLTPDASFSDEGPVENVGGTSPIAGDGDSSGPVADHCGNRQLDADESDTDCGGQDCDACELGRRCEAGADCVNGTCTEGRCQDPSCTDGEKNGSETDADCGGDGCPACADGLRCLDNPDCESASCRGGSCAAPTCDDRITNGNESDLDCGGDCGPCESGQGCLVNADCEQPPEEDPSTTVCQDNTCTLICASGQGDCNQMAADGCEVNLNIDLDHCGTCGAVCAPANAENGKCNGGTCEIDFETGGCSGSWEDCNGMHEDGCEVDTATDTSNCGGCGESYACSDANGTPSCSTGMCDIACSGSYADCDDDARSNGCESDTDASTLHCGTCGNACTPNPGESASCDTSQGSPCVSIACDAPGDCGGFEPCGACDDSSCNDRLDSLSNCGGCGIECAANNANVACNPQGGSSYACEIASCVDSMGANFENCDGQYANGCETNVLEDVTHCGGCNSAGGTNCNDLLNNASLQIASITCNDGGCEITGCNGTWADCDGNAANGCEVNTATNDARCGGCLPTDNNPGAGADCNDEWAHATGECVASACEFVACANSNWGDCENGLADGCETDLRVTDEHCGSCGARCIDDDGFTASNTCSARQCSATCNANGDKCDSNEWNGCENVASSVNNCGSCGNLCGGDGQVGVDSASCSASSCNVTCSNGMCPDSTDAAECVLPLGTTANCTSCGEVCNGATPLCTAFGCDDHYPITVVSTQNFTGNTNTALTNYTLTSDNTRRGLIVAMAVMHNSNYPNVRITWNSGANDADMNLVHRQAAGPSDAAIYYLQEADLPAQGTELAVRVDGGNSWGGVVATVFEVADMYQAGDPVSADGGNHVASACPHTNNRDAAVTHDDSLIIAVSQARENASGVGSPNGGLTEVHDAAAGDQCQGTIGYLEQATATTNVGFDMTICWDSALTTAVFRPYSL